MKSVAILGASADPAKFSHRAVLAYHQAGHRTFPVNPRETTIAGIPCHPDLGSLPERPGIVSVYLPPAKVLELLPSIAARGCDELWLNPGTDSPEVVDAARALGLDVVQACSLVALSGGRRDGRP